MRCFDEIAAVINRDDVDGEFLLLVSHYKYHSIKWKAK